MMPSGVYAVIFDLDGVLTSTSVRHEQSWADAARTFNIPVTVSALRATRSIPRASSLAALLAHACALAWLCHERSRRRSRAHALSHHGAHDC
jgi:beta-phosphoglucomutase-like phosphatase (HAD superfamily)